MYKYSVCEIPTLFVYSVEKMSDWLFYFMAFLFPFEKDEDLL